MYLSKKHFPKTGRTYLSILHGYRDSEGKTKQETMLKIGYLDVMEKLYDDPIAHFEAIAEKMNEEREAAKSVTIVIDMEEELDANVTYRKNYGYIVFSKVYHELEIHTFLKNARRHQNFKFNNDAIMRLLVYTRLLNPSSKRTSYLNKDLFFDKFDFSLDDVYAALTKIYGKLAGRDAEVYSQSLSELLLELREQIIPGKRDVKNGYNKNMAGSG